MKILKSRKGIPIPTLFLVTDREAIKDVPVGVPYFYGNAELESAIIEILEYEVLYQKALSTKLPFDFELLLEEQGFDKKAARCNTNIMSSFGSRNTTGSPLNENSDELSKYVAKRSVYVDVGVIKALNVFPVWMDVLEEAIGVNISSFATFDTNMYNKKLEGMYGGIRLESPNKNLIIIDISSSIPRQVSQTILTLAQNMCLSFYADLMITGGKTTLYDYEDVQHLDVASIYRTNGTDNDQKDFKRLLSTTEKKYDTLICFGDEDDPGYPWSTGTEIISQEEGRALNKWTVNKIISFHAFQGQEVRYNMRNGDIRWDYFYVKDDIAGYARWFTPLGETVIMKDWVKYLKKGHY